MTIYTDTASRFNFAQNKDYLLKMYSNKRILVTECNICNIHKRNRHLLVKKRIKTRRLTNIYNSDDDDVGDGYNLLPTLSLSLSVPLPLPKIAVSSPNVLIFLSTVY